MHFRHEAELIIRRRLPARAAVFIDTVRYHRRDLPADRADVAKPEAQQIKLM